MSKQARPLSILLVEDSRADVLMVQAQLEKLGLNVTLKAVDSLESALQRLGWKRFDIVLLDLTLPDSQGLPTFQKIHAAAMDTPIIVLSGVDDRDLALQAVREGAQDYLSKNKVDSDALIRSIRYAVERARRQRAESELSAAGAMRQQLFPRVAPKLHGFDISARYKPAMYPGGTLLDFFPVGRKQLGIMIAEASGRGIGRALTMAATRSVIRAFATVTEDVGEILTRCNNTLVEDLSLETAVSLLLATVDSSTSTIQFASAGLPGHVLNTVGRAKRVLESHSPALGVESGAKFTTSREIPLEQEDSLFLFTRTVVESKGAGGGKFGEQRLLEAVQDRYAQGAQPVLDHVFEEVKSFLGDSALEEDMTAVIFKALPQSVDATESVTPDAEKGHPTVAHEEYNCFAVDKQGDVAVLRFREKEILSTEKCAEVRNELVGFIRHDRPSRLVISFQAVERFSSEAIEICFHAKKTLTAQNSDLRLCELQPQLLKSFKTVDRKGRLFSIHTDLGKALRSF